MGFVPILTALTALYTVSKTSEAQTDARNAARRAREREQTRLDKVRADTDAAVAKAESEAETAKVTATTEAEAKRRKRLKAAGTQGRASTFKTSPFGVREGTAPVRKTLLGS